MRTGITVAVVSLLMVVAWLTKSWGMVGVAGVLVGIAGYIAGYHDGWNEAIPPSSRVAETKER